VTPDPGKTSPGQIPAGTDELKRLIGLLGRRWKLMAAVPLLCSGLAVAFLLTRPPRYRAMATLVVVPPPFSSSLRPAELSLQAYQRLLESDSVVQETVDRLHRGGVLEDGEWPSVGGALRSRVLLSRDETRSLAPLIEVVAATADPEKAAALANTWAKVLIEHASQVVDDSLRPSLLALEEGYEQQHDLVAELEAARRTRARDFRLRLGRLVDGWEERTLAERQEWDERIVSQRQEGERLVAAYQEQTRRDVAKAAPDSSRDVSDRELGSLIAELVILRAHLAQTPAVIVLDKSITDDALWMRALSSDTRSGGTASTPSESLVTEEQNPVYQSLAQKLSDIEAAVFARVAQEEETSLAAALVGLEAKQRSRSAGLAALQLDRSLEAEKLHQGRSAVLGRLNRAQGREVEELTMERDAQLLELDRDIEAARELLKALSAAKNQASLVHAGRHLADLHLALEARPPVRPDPIRGLLLFPPMAFLAGAVLAVALAALWESARFGRASPSK
jgi:uncharacterized protein involved in exopolysaccharide biosynthesis